MYLEVSVKEINLITYFKKLYVHFRALQPTVIFIDEMDAVMHKPNDTDGGCVTRQKTEPLQTW